MNKFERYSSRTPKPFILNYLRYYLNAIFMSLCSNLVMAQQNKDKETSKGQEEEYTSTTVFLLQESIDWKW